MKIEALVESVLTGGIRYYKDKLQLDEEKYIKETKKLYYLYKRFLICNYESLEQFRKQNKKCSERTKNFLALLQMELLKIDEEYKTLLHILDEFKFKDFYLEVDDDELENHGIFPVKIFACMKDNQTFTYDNYMGDRKYAKVTNINEQCKILAISISKSVSKYKDHLRDFKYGNDD